MHGFDLPTLVFKQSVAYVSHSPEGSLLLPHALEQVQQREGGSDMIVRTCCDPLVVLHRQIASSDARAMLHHIATDGGFGALIDEAGESCLPTPC